MIKRLFVSAIDVLEIWMQLLQHTVLYITNVSCFFVSVSVHHLAFGGHDRLLPSGVKGWLTTPISTNHAPLRNAATCDWTAARCFEFPPFTSSPRGRSEILWVCCRGRAAHTHICGDRLTRTDLRGDLPLVLNSETVNTGLYFYLHSSISTTDKGIFRSGHRMKSVSCCPVQLGSDTVDAHPHILLWIIALSWLYRHELCW